MLQQLPQWSGQWVHTPGPVWWPENTLLINLPQNWCERYCCPK